MELWFDGSEVLSHLWKLGAAFVLALPVAFDRERAARSLGLRTYPLVAMGSCGYILVAAAFLSSDSPEHARILQGLIAGIGFLGGGALLREDDRVRGSATAASVWSTAAVGAAVAYDRIEVALALTLANFITLRWVKVLKPAVQSDDECDEV